MLGHAAGAGALVVDVAQVLQARRRLDVLRAAHAVHGIHLGAIGAQGRGVKAEHGRRRRGGSGEEAAREVPSCLMTPGPLPLSTLSFVSFRLTPTQSLSLHTHTHTQSHTCFIVKVSQCEVTCFCGRGGGLSYRFFFYVCVFFNRWLTDGVTGGVTCKGKGQF